MKSTIKAFKAGVCSIWVQSEKIKVELEGLVLAFESPSSFADRFEELNRQLKQLEDETEI